ncbi:unnamed protein product [Caenorhabditis sp. 36 PRJEB53466]|nr:unnamed protein product [Caenorhabditis sp. 36 PRJEB53466]
MTPLMDEHENGCYSITSSYDAMEVEDLPDPPEFEPNFPHYTDRDREVVIVLPQDQLRYFYRLAILVVRQLDNSRLVYEADHEDDWVKLSIGNVEITLYLEYGERESYMSCSVLRNFIGLPGVSYAVSAGRLLSEILRQLNWQVASFFPKSELLVVGFPTRPFSANVIKFEADNPRSLVIMDVWMRQIVEGFLVHIGEVHSAEAEMRAIHIYRKHFEFRALGWQCPPHMIARTQQIRVNLRELNMINCDFATALYFRWIKGWMKGEEEMKHLNEVYLCRDEAEINENTVRLYLRIPTLNGSKDIVLRNVHGMKAWFRLLGSGCVLFEALAEEPEEKKIKEIAYSLEQAAITGDNNVGFQEFTVEYKLLEYACNFGVSNQSKNTDERLTNLVKEFSEKRMVGER